MSSAVIDELINDWNAMLTFKLKESDLLAPTETFVVKALSTLLGAMSIKDCYTLKMQAENKVEAGIAKTKFVRYVDDLYKVSDPKNNFLYFDLVYPTSKKTIHLLKVLHNYYCYYQFLKKNVLDRVKEKLETRDQLMKTNKDLKVEIERSKMQKELLDKKMENYVAELPVLKNDTQEITAKIKQLSAEVDKTKRATETLSLSNRDALKKIESLNDDLIDEEEVKQLLSDRKKVENELAEIKEHGSATHARFVESHHKKEDVRQVIDEAQKLIELLNVEPLLKQKEEKEQTNRDLKDFQAKLLKVQDELSKVMKDYDLQIKTTKKKLEAKKKKIKQHQKKLSTIQKENEKSKKNLLKQKEELEKEKELLEKSKKEMEQVLIVGQNTLEYIGKGYVQLTSCESA
ncbi:mRNA export factor GLE1-like [Culicoides brevitarsis]|uniref:mRNA export factor GLE1-like n=1 Tax=Culicoides brevitarsis TaxID=469753 RepID=UPI00307C6ADF